MYSVRNMSEQGPYTFDREELKKRPFKIQSLDIPCQALKEQEETVEFKFRAWTGTNLFEGNQTIVVDIPVGENTRVRFDRTIDRWRFIRVRYDKKLIEQLEFPVDGTKDKPLSRLHQYRVILSWGEWGISFAIGNTGLDNLHEIGIQR